jgi:hypothetical protein
MSGLLVALDFDGVVCNGLREYFQTSWRVYCKLWNPEQQPPSEGIENSFYHLRPVVENGWEMPVLIHALESGFREAEIISNWTNIALDLLQHHALDPRSVGTLVDEMRDRWIVEDFEDWLSYQTFYPGIVDYLKQCDRYVIISTKEGRFIQALLSQAGIILQDHQLHGKERQQPKHETLRQLKPHFEHITFIEDRFKTLQTVAKHADLNNIELLLADWGYNLETEREEARQSDRIKLVSIAEFTSR